jgi:hypothetical protein
MIVTREIRLWIIENKTCTFGLAYSG